MNDRFHQLFAKHAAISRTLFGEDHVRGPEAPAAHLVKEANELRDNPRDIMEMADCMNLLMDTCRRAGYTATDLLDAVDRKLDILPGRKWGPPDANGVIEHIREEANP